MNTDEHGLHGVHGFTRIFTDYTDYTDVHGLARIGGGGLYVFQPVLEKRIRKDIFITLFFQDIIF